MRESLIYYSIRVFGFMMRILPVSLAIWIGKRIGMFAYYFDGKHKSLAYANLKFAFAHCKSPKEIKQITKQLFKNYGRNLIELFRMPLLTPQKFDQVLTVKGKENVIKGLEGGKGVIMLAMHFGSWELASFSCMMIGFPYKVFVKPQKKYSRLDDLLNSYRSCGGSVVLSRGSGTRDVIRSLKNNDVIGMVVDQGGRDGVLVPFLGRKAAMSVGAIRMGLKLGIPICFSVIFRENGSRHKMIIHKSFELENTGNLDEDIASNLKKVTEVMESYVYKYPSEYMWFYKIWKYSDESHITILGDGKIGHLRQAESVAQTIRAALGERNIEAKIEIVNVVFKNQFLARLFSLMSAVIHPVFYQGRLECLREFLAEDSYKRIVSSKTNFVVSCGSSLAGVNNLLAKDSNAKSVSILKPGLLNYRHFDLVVLPKHDELKKRGVKGRFVITHAAPNLIDDEYLLQQSNKLLGRYSHLKDYHKMKIGLFVGGDAQTVFLSERQMNLLIRQIKGVLEEIKNLFKWG